MTLDTLIAGWKERRSILKAELGAFATSYPPRDDIIVSELRQQDIARLQGWIAVLDKLIAEHSR
jgi:hypothetical protein